MIGLIKTTIWYSSPRGLRFASPVEAESVIGLHEMELATACGSLKCDRVDQNGTLV